MKVIEYKTIDGSTMKMEYDEQSPCIVCGEPVLEASMGGTTLCPWCDMGICRYCGVRLNGNSEHIKQHIAWHKSLSQKGRIL